MFLLDFVSICMILLCLGMFLLVFVTICVIFVCHAYVSTRSHTKKAKKVSILLVALFSFLTSIVAMIRMDAEQRT
jgi:hypothetical protein